MTFSEHSLLNLSPHGFHRIAYTHWGDPDNQRVLICAHGMGRNSRDFDALATDLAADYRVVCPDMPGRGHSDWLLHPEDYGYPLYLNAMAALLAHLGTEDVDWVGTSMGGLIGMMLAAQPGSPVRRLVMNDIGPFVPKAGLDRLAGYIGKDPRFADAAAAESYMRATYTSFGDLTDAQWAHITRHGIRRDDKGGYALHYDPAVGNAFDGDLADVDQWSVWAGVRCPVLVIRGGDSDLLLPHTASEMVSKGEEVELVEIPGVGHAPALMDSQQIGFVRRWLLAQA